MASRRSIWKGPFVDASLINSVKRVVSSGKNTIIKTWSRRSTILPAFVGIVFSVYNGKKFIPVLVTEQMIGKKLGEFAPTRTFTGHGANKKAVRV